MLSTPKFKQYNLEAMLKDAISRNPKKLEIEDKQYNQEYFDLVGSIALSNGKNRVEIVKGMYLSGLNMQHELDEHYISYIYGVADNYQQVLKHHKDLLNSKMEYVCFITPIYKKDQPAQGGWRWHKWGEYIGDYEISNEYLYDEDIDVVYAYHFFYLDRGNITIRVTNVDENSYTDYNRIEDIEDNTKVFEDDILLFLLDERYKNFNKEYEFELLDNNNEES